MFAFTEADSEATEFITLEPMSEQTARWHQRTNPFMRLTEGMLELDDDAGTPGPSKTPGVEAAEPAKRKPGRPRREPDTPAPQRKKRTQSELIFNPETDGRAWMFIHRNRIATTEQIAYLLGQRYATVQSRLFRWARAQKPPVQQVESPGSSTCWVLTSAGRRAIGVPTPRQAKSKGNTTASTAQFHDHGRFVADVIAQAESSSPTVDVFGVGLENYPLRTITDRELHGGLNALLNLIVFIDEGRVDGEKLPAGRHFKALREALIANATSPTSAKLHRIEPDAYAAHVRAQLPPQKLQELERLTPEMKLLREDMHRSQFAYFCPIEPLSREEELREPHKLPHKPDAVVFMPDGTTMGVEVERRAKTTKRWAKKLKAYKLRSVHRAVLYLLPGGNGAQGGDGGASWAKTLHRIGTQELMREKGREMLRLRRIKPILNPKEQRSREVG